MRVIICLLPFVLVFSIGCNSRKTSVKDESPPKVPDEPGRTEAAVASVFGKPEPAPEAPPDIIIRPAPTTESLPAAKPRLPVLQPVAALRRGFSERGAALRAGALVVDEATHIERWTFADDGIWLHCRANANQAGQQMLKIGERFQPLFGSDSDQQALREAIRVAMKFPQSMERVAWSEGQDFRFRAEKAGETLLIVNAQCRQSYLEENLRAEFEPEFAANAKFRAGSSDQPYQGTRGAYSNPMNKN